MTALRTRIAALPRLLVFATAIAAAGCASSGRAAYDGTPNQATDVQITVENQNFKDATIYAIWGGGTRDRLGMVVGNTTQTFTTRAKMSDVRVEVDFIAGNDVATESLGVFSGDHIHVTIPPGMN